MSGAETGACIVTDSRVVIGSGTEATFQVRDDSVSRNHVEVAVRPEGARVTDMGSTNGTFLSGARIHQMTVYEEANLTIGTTVIRVSRMAEDFDSRPPSRTSFGKVIGRAESMQQLFRQLDKVAATTSTVLLTGETGSGKEIIAESLHASSPRRDKPFVVVDCGNMAPTLIESELFGHVRGAFSGAVSDRKGAFLEADGGTLFLDEVGELPLELQPRMLRALESGTVKRLGEDKPRTVDVRIIAATHRDLEAEVKKAAFREDLFFRLAVVLVRVPPLRERIEDIPLLARQFVAQLGRGDFELPSDLREKLNQHRWPGNVRELRNVIERALAGGDVELGKGEEKKSTAPMSADLAGMQFKDAKEMLVDSFTREYLITLLDRCDGNISEVARTAGIGRNYVHRLVNKYGLRGHD